MLSDYVDGRLPAWPVWDQLTSGGAWVPDLYVGTDKSWDPGEAPSPLGDCHD